MKKKIVFLISRFLDGGIDTVLTEYLNNFDTSKYEINLGIGIKMEGLEVYKDRISPTVAVKHIVDSDRLTHLRRQKITRKLSLWEKVEDEVLLNPKRKRKIKEWLERECRDAYLVIDFDSTFYTPLSDLKREGKLEGATIIGFYHFSLMKNLQQSMRHTLRQMRGMESYDRIALLCDSMVEEGKSLFPDLADKFVRIYNGLDFTKIGEKKEEPMQPEKGVNPYFLSVARLEESQKDNTTLIKAFAEFKRRNPGQEQLRLIGKGKDEETLKALTKELGIDNDVIFMGFVSNPIPWMNKSLANILSSKYEGLPTVLIESLVLSQPTVATDCPTGPSEILGQGRFGVLLPVGDIEKMAVAFQKLARDEDYRADLGNRASEGAARFDIRRSINKLLACANPVDEEEKVPISVVMNTYQAEKYLEEVLDSVKWADEIVMVDMHSTDCTQEIGMQHGARIILTERASYCEPARNLAIKSARNKWVLVLDADEKVPPKLVQFLRSFIAKNNGKIKGIRIPRRNRFMGKEIHSLYPDYVTRFLDRDTVDWPKEIHSQPIIDGEVISIPSSEKEMALIHLEENTLESRKEKIGRYTDFEVQRRGARQYSGFSKIAKPGMRFLRSYVFKGGWRDGKAGLEWAKLEAEYKKKTIEKQEEAFNHQHPKK